MKGTGEDINYKRSVVIRQIQNRHTAKTTGQGKRLSIAEAVAKAMDENHPLFRGDDISGLVSSVSRGNTITRAVIAKMRREKPDWFDEAGSFKPPAPTTPDRGDYVVAPTPLRGLLDSLARDDDQLQ